MKKDKLLFILVFALLLVLPILTFNHKHNVISELDNTYLTEVTEDITSSKYTNNIDDYISKRIGLREETIELYQNVNMTLFTDPEISNVDVGKENELYAYVSGNYTDKEYFDKFAETIIAISKTCEEKNVSFYFMIEPEKAEIYPEYLPDSINYNDDLVQDFIKKIENGGVIVVDNIEYLRNNKDNKRIFNKSFDCFHWNDYGGYLGINNLLSYMQKDFPNITYLDINDYEIKKKTIKYYQNSKLVINDEIEEIVVNSNIVDYTEHERESVPVHNEYKEFGHFINENDEIKDYPRMLCFAGSFLINNKDKFLKDKTKEYIYVHNYQNVFDIDNYLVMFSPDCIVFEVGEAMLKEMYFSKELMDKYISNH